MARPTKNHCEYFSHDRDMRNHRKIKSIRTKFGIAGYGIWVMLIEYLTGSEGNRFEYSEVEIELIAGDFGISVTEITDVLNYCVKLELLFNNDGFIHSESLDNRLKSVYEKRKGAKRLSEQQPRINGKYVANNPVLNGVSVTEIPQSKVNESKVNESKEHTDAHEEIFIPNNIPIPNLNRPPTAPTFEHVKEFFHQQGKPDEAKGFYDYYEGLNWHKGNTPIMNWRSFANRWDVRTNSNIAVTTTQTGDQKLKKLIGK